MLRRSKSSRRSKKIKLNKKELERRAKEMYKQVKENGYTLDDCRNVLSEAVNMANLRSELKL